MDRDPFSEYENDRPTVAELLRAGRQILGPKALGPPGREAALLLARLLGLDEVRLRARDDQQVDAEIVRRYREWLDLRLVGTPIAYLFGVREFYGRDFAVDGRVLVPRPETEHLVEAALARLPEDEPRRLLDVGTGSGCIAVTLACERPRLEAVATDLSMGAVLLARANAHRHRVDRDVRFVRTDLWTGTRLDRFDMVVSNPPYVAPGDAVRMSHEVLDHEPHLALFAEDAGRALLQRLLDGMVTARPGTPLVLEIGYDQGKWIVDTIDDTPHLEFDELIKDYAGHPRTVVALRR